METHVINAMKNEMSDNTELIFFLQIIKKDIRSKFLAIINWKKIPVPKSNRKEAKWIPPTHCSLSWLGT